MSERLLASAVAVCVWLLQLAMPAPAVAQSIQSERHLQEEDCVLNESLFATGICLDLHAQLERTAGPMDSLTLRIANRVLRLYIDLGHTVPAIGPRFDIVAFAEQTARRNAHLFGSDAPATLESEALLALIYVEQKRQSEALSSLERAYRHLDVVRQVHPPAAIDVLVQLAQLRGERASESEVVPLLQTAVAWSRRYFGPQHERTARAIAALAVELARRGRFDAALPPLEALLNMAATQISTRDSDRLQAVSALVQVYQHLGRLQDALRTQREVARMSDAWFTPRDERALDARLALARLLLLTDRPAEAWNAADTVFRTRRMLAGDRTLGASLALVVRGSAAFALGRQDEALQDHQAARSRIEAATGTRHPAYVASTLALAGDQLTLGRAAEARDLYESALAASEPLQGAQHPDTLDALDGVILADVADGHFDRLDRDRTRLLAEVERLRASENLSAANRRSFFERWAARFRWYALQETRRGAHEEAFRIAELSKARTLLDVGALQRASRSGMLAEEELRLLESLDFKLGALTDASAIAVSPSEALALDMRKEALAAQRSQLHRELRERYPKFGQLADVAIVGAKQGLALLGPDEVFVSYLLVGEQPLAFALTRQHGLTAVALPPVPRLAQTIDAYRQLLSKPDGAHDLALFGRSAWRLTDGSFTTVDGTSVPEPGAEPVRDVDVVARHLGTLLLQAEPLRSLLLAHRRWVISPDGPLAFLPFESLPLDGRVAVLEHDIRQVQSLSVWQLLRERLDANRLVSERRALLAVGNPVFPRQTIDEPVWDELADSGREIQSIAAMFEPLGSQTLVRQEATEVQVQALNRSGALRGFRYLHFATHAYVDTQNAERSAIVLGVEPGEPPADGRITAAEWAAYDLRSDLMVVSACETGIGLQVAGEGVMGLPYALYVAGNAATALSLWKVDSAATADFMIAFFGGLRRGLDPVEAMAAVKRQYLREPGQDHHRRPYYWATFILYGP